MDKKDVITLINSYISAPNIGISKAIIEEYLIDKEMPNKNEKIDALLRLPIYNSACVDYAIEQLCARHELIKVIDKNGLIVKIYD